MNTSYEEQEDELEESSIHQKQEMDHTQGAIYEREGLQNSSLDHNQAHRQIVQPVNPKIKSSGSHFACFNKYGSLDHTGRYSEHLSQGTSSRVLRIQMSDLNLRFNLVYSKEKVLYICHRLITHKEKDFMLDGLAIKSSVYPIFHNEITTSLKIENLVEKSPEFSGTRVPRSGFAFIDDHMGIKTQEVYQDNYHQAHDEYLTKDKRNREVVNGDLFNRVGRKGENHSANENIGTFSHHKDIQSLINELKENCYGLLLKKQNKRNEDQPPDCRVYEDGQAEYVTDINEKLCASQLLKLSCEDKESSIKVQLYLTSLNKKELEGVVRYFLRYIPKLCKDKNANYVIQYMIESNSYMKKSVQDLLMNNFLKYAENEYGSRVIQKISILDKEFMIKTLEKFGQNFDRLIENITGSILISKLIANCDDNTVSDFILDILEKNKEYLKKAYFNRMLSTLVNCCSEDVLDRIINNIHAYIWLLMNDKFGNYLLQLFFERKNKKAMDLVYLNCLQNSNLLFIKKYPKFLLIKILEKYQVDQDFLKDLVRSVLEEGKPVMVPILQRRDSSYLFLLTIAHLPYERISEIGGVLEKTYLSYPKCNLVSNSDNEYLRTFREISRLSYFTHKKDSGKPTETFKQNNLRSLLHNQDPNSEEHQVKQDRVSSIKNR